METWLTAECQNIPEKKEKERVNAFPLQRLLQCADTVTPETPQGNAWSSETAKEPNGTQPWTHREMWFWVLTIAADVFLNSFYPKENRRDS